ncbi:acyl-CoA/acyl-ACP dehydrogenase [Nocardia speluncae]|uniref:Acyl-CoA/acyl-ACP dehydrogenase n=1 Tax=Nocardia speluncae TaxID=419477 RepID=A0A846XA25_9NOCA|nr:acyl-CoA dehydrogenase family protein [Nocardia speluncae]NKY32812.1 acyl-CoA/acyl-ACP dehydrogenase [Nocardia speluncae]
MHFALSEDQVLLQRTTEEISAQLFSNPSVPDLLTGGTALRAAVWKTLVELDLVGLLIPEEYGGGGGSVLDACLVAEVLGRHIAPVPYVGTAIAAASLLRFAGGPAADLARLAAGEAHSVLLGSTLEVPEGTATIAFDWSAGARGVALSSDGVAAAHELSGAVPFEGIDPLHPLSRVQPIPAVVATDDGDRRAWAAAWVGAAAFLLGLADGALKQAVDYARQREQYGHPIGSFQSIQHLCAEMLFRVESSRSITYGASWAVDHAPIDEVERLASAAKFYAGSAAVEVCETAIQILGGIGVTQEHSAHFRLRSAHLFHSAFGGSDAPLLLLADRALETV